MQQVYNPFFVDSLELQMFWDIRLCVPTVLIDHGKHKSSATLLTEVVYNFALNVVSVFRECQTKNLLLKTTSTNSIRNKRTFKLQRDKKLPRIQDTQHKVRVYRKHKKHTSPVIKRNYDRDRESRVCIVLSLDTLIRQPFFMEGKSILTPPSTFVAHAHKSWGEGSSVEFYYPSCTPRLPLTTRTPAFPIL